MHFGSLRARLVLAWSSSLITRICSSVVVSKPFALRNVLTPKIDTGISSANRRYSRRSGTAMSSSYRGGGGGRGGGRGQGGGGRGQYYKNKYGRKSATQSGTTPRRPSNNNNGGTYEDLRRVLEQIDGRGYPSYHDLDTPASSVGWKHDMFTLFVGRSQSDPFAPPTRCRVVVHTAELPPSLYSNAIRAIALSDYLQRVLYAKCKSMGADECLSDGKRKYWSGPKGGDVQVLEPCQHVLEQTAVQVDPKTGTICAQVTINLPARGRTVLGQAAREIFDTVLVDLVKSSLQYASLTASHVAQHVDSVDDQYWLQSQLKSHNLVAFVPNGAILPRTSGVDARPMASASAIPFESPRCLQVSFTLPNSGEAILGMGIPTGITLICGGGFHGKSTLLSALQLGVYLKIPGDGREFCVTLDSAMKIRAEDGRSVTSVDISPFIDNLPFGKDTTCFTSPDASGSTSQASNIVEAVEMGTNLILVDEDTCATNFMIRDDKMMQLVAPEKEPITPFVHKVRPLLEERGISSILVIGGSGDYFDVADTILMMDCYKCTDVTERAKEIATSASADNVNSHLASKSIPFGSIRKRYPGIDFSPMGKVKTISKGCISYGDVEIDLSGLEQIVTKSQTAAISSALQVFGELAGPNSSASLPERLAVLDRTMTQEGLSCLSPHDFNGTLVRPRLLEIAGAINRFRRNRSVLQKEL